nr:putative GH32 family protein a [Tetranychus urticae]
MVNNLVYSWITLIVLLSGCSIDTIQLIQGMPMQGNTESKVYGEKWRPQYHFSPPTSWINDPSGLTYSNGKYHLFYQYHPDSLVWGPMHWGHATSSDLLRWENEPIALYPDQGGAAFSGSAVIDSTNITGLQKTANTNVFVAIFTRSNDSSPTPQTQHLAYSYDGITFNNYEKNPILVDPSKRDFRDPSLVKYGDGYIMSLAAGDAAMFYKSTNLIDWTYLSSFGEKPSQGSHMGFWECPALIRFEVEGRELWVLISSINPGGLNVGSATQYFVGTFDGTRFINENPADRVLWLDYGPDNYAAAKYTNIPSPKPTMIAWMSNWNYATNQPTTPWRGQMTLPRSMELVKTSDNDYHVQTFPIDDVKNLRESLLYEFRGEPVTESLAIQHNSDRYHLECSFKSNRTSLGAVKIKLMNQASGEQVTMNLDNLRIEVDRSQSGLTNFSSDFTKLIRGSRILPSPQLSVDLFFDSSAVELFYDKGLSSFTYLVFPTQPYDLISIECTDCTISSLSMYQMKSIWKNDS